MPIYEYRCDACERRFEELTSFAERDRARACPSCERTRTRLLVSRFAAIGGVGGCELVELARGRGTPLYVYDAETVRLRCREYIAAMAHRGEVLSSAKAFASPGFLRVVASEGLGLDVVSAGELHVALAAGFRTDRLHFLGNNKSVEDVAAAWEARAILVIDGFHDLELLGRVVPAGARMRCQVRV